MHASEYDEIMTAHIDFSDALRLFFPHKANKIFLFQFVFRFPVARFDAERNVVHHATLHNVFTFRTAQQCLDT